MTTSKFEKTKIYAFAGSAEEAESGGHTAKMDASLHDLLAKREKGSAFVFVMPADKDSSYVLINGPDDFLINVFLSLGHKLGVPDDVLQALGTGIEIQRLKSHLLAGLEQASDKAASA